MTAAPSVSDQYALYTVCTVGQFVVKKKESSIGIDPRQKSSWIGYNQITTTIRGAEAVSTEHANITKPSLLSDVLGTAEFKKVNSIKAKRRTSVNMETTVALSKEIVKHNKRTLSMSRLFSLNAIVCGLEFCASAAFCYIPPLLLKAGISEQYMSMILGIGPLLGFFIVPIIGQASDRCESRFGRRRPFIFGLSILLLLSLFMIPFGDYVSYAVFGHTSLGKTMTFVCLVVGSFLLDFTCQTCLTPCEALLSDSSRDTDKSERCFTIYSIMVSIGGCVGYLITALDWSDSSIGLYFGSQERSVFIMLIILYSFSMLLTFGAAHEVPLPELQRRQAVIAMHVSHNQSPLKVADHGYVSDDIISEDTAEQHKKLNNVEMTYKIPMTKLSFTRIEQIRHFILLKLYSMVPNVIKVLFHVPFVLKRLAFANFCSWTAIMGFNLFFTNFVGQTIYGGDPNAPEDSELRALYDKGVRMGSWGLLFHCINSAMYATVIEKLSARLGLRGTYMVGMVTFTLAMVLMVSSRNIYVVNLCAMCTGFGYATLTTVPFMLITAYHENKEIYFYDIYASDDASLAMEKSVRGMGTDLAILDSAYFLSQVVLTAFMGYIVHFAGTALAYIVCASAMGFLACFSIRNIVLDKAQMQLLIKSNRISRCQTIVN